MKGCCCRKCIYLKSEIKSLESGGGSDGFDGDIIDGVRGGTTTPRLLGTILGMGVTLMLVYVPYIDVLST